MREEVKILKLDRPKQGMALTALVDYRNKQIADGKCADLPDELIQDIFNTPIKHRKSKERRDVR